MATASVSLPKTRFNKNNASLHHHHSKHTQGHRVKTEVAALITEFNRKASLNSPNPTSNPSHNTVPTQHHHQNHISIPKSSTESSILQAQPPYTTGRILTFRSDVGGGSAEIMQVRSSRKGGGWFEYAFSRGKGALWLDQDMLRDMVLCRDGKETRR